MGLFRTQRASHRVAATPALMFRDLRHSGEVKFLWAHQEKLLEEYHGKHLQAPNVALELPTGAGKTLVGLLIAEHRRRANGERVAYLCPTRQLCHQVKAHADQYGVASSLLVGRQREYDLHAFTAYQRSQATAITTYSALFNTNPRIGDPQIIICDDAHASDNYISALWSVLIDRHERPDFFQALVDLLDDAIPEDMGRRIAAAASDPKERSWVDLVPAPLYADRLAGLGDLLEAHCKGTDLAYPWDMIRGHLEACLVYVSPHAILIRPYIPPTQTHRPFMGATQRIFMSATLGEGGELERLTGISPITRLPIQQGWEKRGTGRRLVLFPDLLTSEDVSDRAVEEVLARPPRTLVLVREKREVDQFPAAHFKGLTVIRAKDIEDDLTAFTEVAAPAILILANRYDGIDFRGDSCRQVVLIGLPAATNLQERFLLERFGASAVLRDRIRTRLTQGVGRCTRDEADYALVLLVGDKLLSWCATTSNVRGMHPELQAEIAFGLDNSNDRTLDEFRQLVAAFFAQGEEWATADEELVARRDACERVADPVTATLDISIAHELGFVYALWRHDFERAYDEACQVAETLAGGSELKPYRALWHYGACIASDLAWRRSGDVRWQQNFQDHVRRLVVLSPSLPGFARMQVVSSGRRLETPQPSVSTRVICDLLLEWHLIGARFERRLNAARRKIAADAALEFEEGLATLGRMLGCDVHACEGAGVPDGLWILNNGTAIVFEAKSEETKDDPVSLSEVRQALTHEPWVRSLGELSEGALVRTVLVTPRSTIREEVRLVAGDIYYASVAQVRELFSTAAALLNELRRRAYNLPDDQLRELIDEGYREQHLTHGDLIGRLLSRKLIALPVM